MITYSNRTAVQQGVTTLLIGSRSTLPASFNAGGFASTYGRSMFLDQDYTTAPSPGNAANFPTGAVNTIIVDRTALDNTFTNLGEVAIGDNIFTKSNTTGSTTITVDCSKTPMPASGTTTQSRFNPSIVKSAGVIGALNPPQPILDSLGNLRAAFGVDGTLGGTSPPAGNVYMMNMTLMTIILAPRFEGFDATTAGNSNMSWRPKNDASGNFGLWSGVYIGTGTRPLLIDANLSGTENGRFTIFLSDPTWDAVLNQPVATNTMKQLLPCNAGWVAPWSINAVSPPSFIVFNEDMTKYWIYVIQAIDADAIAAIVTVGWGNSFSERIWVPSPPPVGQGVSGDFQIFGAVGNPPLLMQNPGTPQGTLLMPPYPPVITATCVPCAPIQMDGGKWVGRLAT